MLLRYFPFTRKLVTLGNNHPQRPMHLSPLISDLALIMILGGSITLLFKWMKQPVVLGYIVAGFLASANFPLLPSIQEVSSIHIWAEIGIIFLLFALGLEFSFKKLIHVGGSAFITALLIMTGMMLSGFATGKLLGWDKMDCIFLGAMLSMSSTTIIIKAFDDLGLKNQKFTTTVFGVLVVEDLFAILMMVILSSIAVTQQVEGIHISESVFKLVFFLLLWFFTGIYLIPLFLRKVKRFLNAETLLVVAVGLCLGMVVIANAVGFSSALGAFIMGSILAETIEAESIEKIIKPVKDLFGAIFFVSVGMLVDPPVLVEYAVPIIILTALVIFGQVFFATSGILLSGQPLKIAIQSGFSLAQIGEFAFIIATLGTSLKVTAPFLYPVAVAVSVITTFATPFIMRLSGPVYVRLQKQLPPRWIEFLERYSGGSNTVNRQSEWQELLKGVALHVLIHVILLSGIVWGSFKFGSPLLINKWGTEVGSLVSSAATLALMAPLLWSMSFKRVKRNLFRTMWTDSRYNHGPLMSIAVLRFLLSLVFVMTVLVHFYSFRLGTIVGFSVLCMLVILFSKQIRRTVTHLEKTMIRHLNERENAQRPRIDNLIHDIHMAEFEVSPDSELIGRYLYKADFRNNYGVSIVSIHRGSKHIHIPGARDQLMPYDHISVVGNDEQIKSFGKLVELRDTVEFANQESVGVEMKNLTISDNSFFAGKTIRDSNFQAAHTLVISIQRKGGEVIQPAADMQFLPGDLVTLVGPKDKLQRVTQGFCSIS